MLHDLPHVILIVSLRRQFGHNGLQYGVRQVHQVDNKPFQINLLRLQSSVEDVIRKIEFIVYLLRPA